MKRKKPKSRTGELIEMSSAVTDAFSQRDISAYSGQAAFFLILSFFPFMMFFFALLDMTPLTAEEFAGWAKTLIPESFWGVITQFVDDIYAGSSGGRLSVTIITAVFLSAKAFISLQNGMNSMYQAEETRNIIVRELYAMLYSIIFAVMLLFVLGFMVFGNYIYHRFFNWIPLWGSMVQFRTLICIPILFLFFLVLYVALPNKKQKIKKQIPGAAISAAAWVIFSSLFSVYVDKYTKYATFYGTVTIIALIMVWLYGCMYVVFLGGFINCALEEKYWK
ncbi:MAG: YihY/virulence factor BrkB family protein [Blautia sp.]|nr:YihY/virulence factor BrkB family protein [Blautia sp.]